MKLRIGHVLTWIAASSTAATAADCDILKKDTFVPQNKAVDLARQTGLADGSQFIVYKTGMRVNTDGAPTSYHPQDPRGQTKAINNIVNGVGISKAGTKLSYAQKIAAFEKFRDTGWVVPAGYKIDWQNVIAPETKDGRTIPCTFKTGSFAGYFGSLTTLKNGLPAADSGECAVKDQLDQRLVPGLVKPGGANPIQSMGGKIGDLALAINPSNGQIVAAVVADGGPSDNLGEGSVAMNMALLGKTEQPSNYGEAKKLDTGNLRILVAILPGSREFQPAKPYSAENIKSRVEAWAKARGYNTTTGLADAIKACAAKIP